MLIVKKLKPDVEEPTLPGALEKNDHQTMACALTTALKGDGPLGPFVRDGGMNLCDAPPRAGTTRFRPIITTTLAMILAVVPLAPDIRRGVRRNAAMAYVVIGGPIPSKILALVAAPVVPSGVDGFGRGGRQWFPNRPDHATMAGGSNVPTIRPRRS